MEAIILSAGFGRRLRPLTKNIPKPLLKYKSKPLILHNILKLFYFGVNKFFINAYYLSDKLRNFINKIYGVEIIFNEEIEILGTGGGVYSFRNFIKNNFFIIHNADIYHNIDISKAIKFHLDNNSFLTLILRDDFENKVILENLKVIGFSKENKKQFFTYTGICIANKEFFKYLDYKCSLISGFERAILNKENVLGYITDEFFLDAVKIIF